MLLYSKSAQLHLEPVGGPQTQMPFFMCPDGLFLFYSGQLFFSIYSKCIIMSSFFLYGSQLSHDAAQPIKSFSQSTGKTQLSE